MVAGAMSMAAGEYAAVHSLEDSQQAALARKQHEIDAVPGAERKKLADIYVRRWLSHDLATQVAAQLTAYDAMGSYARDELGITEVHI
jgi:VIT1/CCC1 family predicted Fe2+/Mn2+ transporter